MGVDELRTRFALKKMKNAIINACQKGFIKFVLNSEGVER